MKALVTNITGIAGFTGGQQAAQTVHDVLAHWPGQVARTDRTRGLS